MQFIWYCGVESIKAHSGPPYSVDLPPYEDEIVGSDLLYATKKWDLRSRRVAETFNSVSWFILSFRVAGPRSAGKHQRTTAATRNLQCPFLRVLDDFSS